MQLFRGSLFTLLKVSLCAIALSSVTKAQSESDAPYLFADAPSFGQDWYDTWIGLVNTNPWPWVYQVEVGWVYAGLDGNSDTASWFYFQHEALDGWYWSTENALGWYYGTPSGQSQPNWWYYDADYDQADTHFYFFSADGQTIVSREDVSLRPQTPEIPTPYRFDHPLTFRVQWNANYGYCGETSFIIAGLNLGQYCSQYTARSIASPGVDQARESSQLLLGVNDSYAARQMRLQASEFDYENQSSTEEFLTWVKQNTLASNVVIIGVFNNIVLLDEDITPDPEYDHIVVVHGVGSEVPFSLEPDTYRSDDVITITDHGLFGPFGEPERYQFAYSSRFNLFMGDREQADDPRGPIYLLRETPQNYGIAIEGVLDLDEVTIPVRLVPNLNHEPTMQNGNTPPIPIPLTLTAHVTIPDTTVAYRLYRYDDFAKVPVANFNASADDAVEVWDIPAGSGDTFSVTLDVMTDSTVIFRAVPASAP